jgi:hypothetical protein
LPPSETAQSQASTQALAAQPVHLREAQHAAGPVAEVVRILQVVLPVERHLAGESGRTGSVHTGLVEGQPGEAAAFPFRPEELRVRHPEREHTGSREVL